MALKSKRRFISLNNIKSGMMIEFSYAKENGDTDSYQVIVIDPNKSVDGKSYLHALLLENMSDADIINMATQLGNEFNIDPDKRNEPVTNLKSDAAYSRYKGSSIRGKRIYRTFLRERIKGTPRQILVGTPG